MSNINGGSEYNQNEDFQNYKNDLSDSLSDAANYFNDATNRKLDALNKGGTRAGTEAGAVNNRTVNNRGSGANTGKEAGNAGNASSKGRISNNATAPGTSSAKSAEAGKAGAEAGKTASETGKTAAEAGKTAAETGKTGTEAGNIAAGAAATGATGGAAGVAMLAADAAFGKIKGTKAAFNEITQNGEDTQGGELFGNIFKYAIIVVFVVFIAFMGCFYTGGISSSQNENNQEIQYVNIEINGHNENSERNDLYTETNREIITEELDCDHPYAYSAKEYRRDSKDAITKAIEIELQEIIKALGRHGLKKFRALVMDFLHPRDFRYDEERSMLNLWDQPYPYTLKINEDEYYTIGDFLKTVGYSGDYFEPANYKEMPKDPEFDDVNNDLNYSELTVVMSQGEMYTTRGGTYKSYKKWFTKKENRELLFELTAGGVGHEWGLEDGDPFIYEGWWKILGVDDNGNEYVIDEGHVGPTEDKEDPEFDKCDEKIYYLKPIVKPYGLRELYKISGVETYLVPDYIQPGDQYAINQPPDKKEKNGVCNYEMLDYSEKYDRVYARMGDLGNKGIEEGENYLGPSCLEPRSELSHSYGAEHTITGEPLDTGRSANYFIPLEYLITAEDIEEMVNGDWKPENQQFIDPALIEAIDDETIRLIIEEALRIAYDDRYQYSQGSRMSEFMYDCSSFVGRIYSKFGINISPSSTTRTLLPQVARIDRSQLQPGDLVFRVYPNGEPHHVAIYIGDGYVVHARGQWLNQEKGIKRPPGEQISVTKMDSGFNVCGRLPKTTP